MIFLYKYCFRIYLRTRANTHARVVLTTYCFLLLVNTINISLSTDLVDPPPMGTFYMKHTLSVTVSRLVRQQFCYWFIVKYNELSQKTSFQSVPIAALCLYNIQRKNLVFKNSLCMYKSEVDQYHLSTCKVSSLGNCLIVMYWIYLCIQIFVLNIFSSSSNGIRFNWLKKTKQIKYKKTEVFNFTSMGG